MIEIVKYLNAEYSFFIYYELFFLRIFWSLPLTCIYTPQTSEYTSIIGLIVAIYVVIIFIKCINLFLKMNLFIFPIARICNPCPQSKSVTFIIINKFNKKTTTFYRCSLCFFYSLCGHGLQIRAIVTWTYPSGREGFARVRGLI